MSTRRDAPSLKLIQGVRPSDFRAPEPQPANVEPEPPKEFTERELEVWHAVVEDLRAMGCLFRADQYEIRHYVASVVLFEQTREKINALKDWVVRSSTGGTTVNPLIVVHLRLTARCSALARTLGLSPSGRTLIHGITRLGKPNTEAGNALTNSAAALFG